MDGVAKRAVKRGLPDHEGPCFDNPLNDLSVGDLTENAGPITHRRAPEGNWDIDVPIPPLKLYKFGKLPPTPNR